MRLKKAAHLGLVAKWSREFGYVSIHDPTTGKWHDVETKDAPDWAVGEAHKRKSLWKAEDRRAFNLTREQMEAIWEEEHPPSETTELGIVEEHPLEYEEE